MSGEKQGDCKLKYAATALLDKCQQNQIFFCDFLSDMSLWWEQIHAT